MRGRAIAVTVLSLCLSFYLSGAIACGCLPELNPVADSTCCCNEAGAMRACTGHACREGSVKMAGLKYCNQQAQLTQGAALSAVPHASPFKAALLLVTSPPAVYPPVFSLARRHLPYAVTDATGETGQSGRLTYLITERLRI